ncbi:MAG TPA: GNAT family N-acetyltransferase [Tepidisphaeraceae bacterium]|nr:GNAT family N-acetyltransferase [Tepidisphaeraceae bacterium]
MLVQRVPVDAILALRHRILRADLPFDAARFDGDPEEFSAHFAAFNDAGIVIGCATIHQRPWLDTPAWQLRGMAVDTAVQRTGAGTALLRAIEAHVLSTDFSHQLWCNARLVAISFYERNGWEKTGPLFEIPTAGPHYKMTRRLDRFVH